MWKFLRRVGVVVLAGLVVPAGAGAAAHADAPADPAPRLVRDIVRGAASADIVGLTAVGNRMCFVASTGGAGGRTLWSSDGTATGTHSLPAPVPNDNDGGRGPVISGRHYFVTHQAGHYPRLGGWSKLWRTDCAGGASLVSSTSSATYQGLTSAGQRVYVYAQSNSTPHLRYIAAYAGTHFLGVIKDRAVPRTQTVGNRLYIIDGSSRLLKVDSGANAMAVASTKLDRVHSFVSVVAGRLIVLNNYRETDHSVHGAEIWGTDGTGPGTQMLYQSDTYDDGSTFYVNWLGSTATRGFFTDANSNQLFSTDGTAAGTTPIATGGIGPLAIAGDKLFFEKYDPSTGDDQLWTSDGTSSGTTFVTVLPHAVIRSITAVGDVLLMAVDNPGVPTTDNLWTSDGTAAGTREVSSQTFTPMWLGDATLVQPGVIAFVADDGVHGYELWRTDLTESGTRLVADLYPGSQSSNPGCEQGDNGCPFPNAQHLVTVNGALYFTADTPDAGRELWAWTPQPA